MWFKPLRRGTAVTDLKVQRLGGKPVLTWWQGRVALGHGVGSYVIADTAPTGRSPPSTPANGYQADLHEFLLTTAGRRCCIAYDRVQRDLRFVGGRDARRRARHVVQEVDLATGRPLRVALLDHIPIKESYSEPDGAAIWDYFHLNSVDPDPDGNLLVSARNTTRSTSSTARPARSSGASAASAATSRSTPAPASPGSTTPRPPAGRDAHAVRQRAPARRRCQASRSLRLERRRGKKHGDARAAPTPTPASSRQPGQPPGCSRTATRSSAGAQRRGLGVLPPAGG